MKTRGYWVGWAGVLAGLLLAGCSQEAKLARHLVRGNAHFEAGRYEEATLEYLNVLREDRSNEVAIVRSGLAHFELGNIREAVVLLREGAKLEPENLDVRRKLGMLYRLGRMLPEARGEALAILEQAPGDLDALLLLLDASYQPEEIAEAESRLVAHAEELGGEYKYHLAMAQLHVRKNEREPAEASLARALELAPEEVVVLEALADFHVGLGQTDQAEAYLGRAVANAEPVSETRAKWAALLYAKGEKDEALGILREMVKENPSFLPAWTRLGQYAMAERRLDDCREAVDAILAAAPEHFLGRLLQAQLWLIDGESGKAADALGELITRNPNLGTLHHQLGLAHLQAGRVDEARSELRQAVTLDRNLVPAALQLAELNLRTGQAATAARDLEALIGERGGFPEAMILLARSYLANNDVERALATFQGLEEMQPESHAGPYLRGEVLLRERRNREAREAFETALERAPGQVPIIARLAVLDLREDDSEAAVARVQAAIEANPGHAGLHQVLGVIQAQLGRPELAEAAFRKAIETAPDQMSSYLALARLLVQQDRADDALTGIEQALAEKPDDVRALVLSGMLLEEKGEYENALARYERILELEPRFAQAANNAAYIYAERLGEVDKAFELAKRARELAPKDGAIADTLGWIAYRRGEYPWALTLIQEAAESHAENPEVLYHLGLVQLAMGREAAAGEALARALEHDEGRLAAADQARALAELLAVAPGEVGPAQREQIDAVLAADPQNPAARLRQAILGAQANTPDGWAAARAACEEILNTHPQYLPAALELIDLYAGPLADPAAGLRLARQMREDRPEDVGLTRRAGWLALREGDYPWAHSLLQESARMQPRDPAAQYEFAVAAYHVGRPDEAARTAAMAVGLAGDAAAAADAKRFLDLLRAAASDQVDPAMRTAAETIAAGDPLHLPAQMVLARVREQDGDAAGATALYRQILDRAPALAPAAREAARLYAEVLKDPDQAYPLATRAREALPQDDEVARILGSLAFQRKDYPYAQRLLEQALNARPDHPEILYLLGLSRHEQGDASGARQALERALHLAPDSPHAARASEILTPPE